MQVVLPMHSTIDGTTTGVDWCAHGPVCLVFELSRSEHCLNLCFDLWSEH